MIKCKFSIRGVSMDAVKKKKSKKKLIITLVVIAVVIAVLFGACSMLVGSAKKQMEAAMNAMQTDVVSMRSLTKSIGATGKVVSVQTEDVTTQLMGVQIEDILVDVGDMVEEGQLLVQLDTEDIAKNLDVAQRALGQTQGQFGISNENAQRTVEDARRGAEYQAEAAWSSVDQTYDAYIEAFDSLDDLEQAEEDALDAWYMAQDALSKARDAIHEAMDEAEENKIEVDLSSVELSEDCRQLIEEGLNYLNVYIAGNTIADAQTALAQAQAAVAQAEAAYEQAKNARESMENNIPKLYDAYQMALLTYENTVASGESTVASAQAAQQSATLSANTDQQQLQIDSLSEQLEQGTVTAPFSGVVTAVNYDDGDTYAQGPILTIQDISSFEIEAQIGEYDIPDIKLGQKVLIKTDATREQELEGTVVFIAPTATAAMSSMSAMGTAAVSTDPTYEVRISVDTDTDRLRLDMSANLSIIIQEVEDAMTVPYNAVQTAEDGSTFVEVVNEDETTTVVPVTVVLESSYYTQIRGDLQEGQTIRVISQDASDMFSVMSEMSSAAGGF